MSLSDTFPLLTGGGGCIVALTIGIYLLVTGRLIPKSTHERIVADKDQQIADLTRTVGLERQRSDASTLAAQASRDVLLALNRYRPDELPKPPEG